MWIINNIWGKIKNVRGCNVKYLESETGTHFCLQNVGEWYFVDILLFYRLNKTCNVLNG